MKIAVCSDLHLEFGGLELKNTEGAKVLILSGDILCAKYLNRHYSDSGPYEQNQSSAYVMYSVCKDFLDNVSYEFPKIIYVAGNHEFYGSKWNKTLEILKSSMEDYPNIFFLENDVLTVEDVMFVGCSLWTDMNDSDPLTLSVISSHMSDYRHITFDGDGYYCRLKPSHTVDRHIRSREYIRLMVNEHPENKFVVCTHHAPSFQSIPLKYRDQEHSNGAYASRLEEFIMDHPQIKMWTHGHTHDEMDYILGETRVICNPRGYKGYEQRAKNFELKYFDI